MNADPGMPSFVETPEAIAAAVDARAVAASRRDYERHMLDRLMPGRRPVTCLSWGTVKAPFVDETQKYRLRGTCV